MLDKTDVKAQRETLASQIIRKTLDLFSTIKLKIPSNAIHNYLALYVFDTKM